MQTTFLIIFIVIDVCACFLNFTTLVYITKTFNIKVHVFTLIFLDSLISTTCCICSTFLDLFLSTTGFQPNYIFCFFLFMFSYFPNCCGAFLTLLISLIRYLLAKKSAKNIQPANQKVLLIALALFAVYATIICAFCVIHAVLDLALAYIIEVLLNPEQNPRSLRLVTIIFLQIPNYCNLLSLVIDIQMLNFLKKVIIPTKGIFWFRYRFVYLYLLALSKLFLYY